MDNVHVAIRVRPLIQREKNAEAETHWKADTHTITQLDQRGKACRKEYLFDRVFDSSETTNDVYEEIAQPIVLEAMDGINGTIFAYGQTSSGKTYTMMGDNECPGIIPCAIQEIFNNIENTPNREFLLRVSYMELYNEGLCDLLSSEKKSLQIRENDKKVFVHDLTEEIVTEAGNVFQILKKGEARRHFGQTDMNERSSRSHTIFRMIIESREIADRKKSLDSAVKVSHLNLVDLAGSERANETKAEGTRLKEACRINQSLHQLAMVINKLSQGAEFIPFRDSKLTRILQMSLGGNAKTAIICTVTPAYVDQTHSTLQFASRAKTIKNKPQVNEVLSDEAMMQRQKKQIQELKRKILELEQQGEVLEEKASLHEQQEQKIQMLQKMILVSGGAVIPSIMPGMESKKAKYKRRQTWCPGMGNPLPLFPLSKPTTAPTTDEMSFVSGSSPPSVACSSSDGADVSPGSPAPVSPVVSICSDDFSNTKQLDFIEQMEYMEHSGNSEEDCFLAPLPLSPQRRKKRRRAHVHFAITAESDTVDAECQTEPLNFLTSVLTNGSADNVNERPQEEHPGITELQEKDLQEQIHPQECTMSSTQETAAAVEDLSVNNCCSSLQQQVIILEGKIAILEEERAASSQSTNNQMLEQACKELREKNDELERKVQSLEEENLMVNQLSDTLCLSEEKVIDLESQARDADRKVAKLNEDIVIFKAQLEQQDGTADLVHKSELEILTLKAQLEERDDAVSAAAQQTELEVTNLQGTIKELEDAISNLKTEKDGLSALPKSLQEKEKQLEKLCQMFQEAEDTMSMLQQEKTVMCQELEQQNEKIQAREEEIETLNVIMEEGGKEVEEARSHHVARIAELTALVEEQQGQIALNGVSSQDHAESGPVLSLADELGAEDWQSKARNTESELLGSVQLCEEIMEEKTKLSNHILQIQAEYNSLKEALRVKMEELQNLQDLHEFTQIEAEVRKEHEVQYQNDIEKLEQKLKDQEDTLAAQHWQEMQELQKKLAAKDKVLEAQYQQDIDELLHKLREKNQRFDALQEQNSGLVQALNQKEQLTENLQEQLNGVECSGEDCTVKQQFVEQNESVAERVDEGSQTELSEGESSSQKVAFSEVGTRVTPEDLGLLCNETSSQPKAFLEKMIDSEEASQPEALLQRITILESREAALRQDCDSLSTTIGSRDQEIEVLNEILQDYGQEKDEETDSASKITAFVHRIEHLEEQLRDSACNNRVLAPSDEQACNQGFQVLTHENKHLADALTQTENLCDKLKEKIQNLEESLKQGDNASAELTHLREELHVLKANNLSLSEKLTAIQVYSKELEERVLLEKGEQNKSNQEVHNLAEVPEQQLQDISQKAELEQTADELRSRVGDLEDGTNKLSQENQVLLEKCRASEQVYNDIVIEKVSLIEEKSVLKQLLHQGSNQIQELEAALALMSSHQSQKAAESRVGDLEDGINKLSQENQVLLEKCRVSEQVYNDIVIEKASLMEQQSVLKQLLQESSNKIQELEAALALMSSQSQKAAESRDRDLEDGTNKLSQENQVLLEKCRASEQVYNDIVIEKASLIEEKSVLKQLLQQGSNQIQELEAALALMSSQSQKAAESRVGDLEDGINKLSQENQVLLEKCRVSEQVYNDIVIEKASLMEQQSVLKQLLQESSNKIQELEAALALMSSQSQKAAESRDRDLEDGTNKLSQENQVLLEKCRASEQVYNDIVIEKASLIEEKSVLKQLLQQGSNQIQELEAALALMSSQSQKAAESRVIDLEDCTNKLSQENQVLLEKCRASEQVYNDIVIEKASLMEQQSVLKQLLQESSNKIQELDAALALLTSQSQEAAEIIKNRDDEIEMLRQVFVEQDEQLETTRNDYNRSVSRSQELKRNVDALNQKDADRAVEIEDKHNEVCRLQGILEHLEEQVLTKDNQNIEALSKIQHLESTLAAISRKKFEKSEAETDQHSEIQRLHSFLEEREEQLRTKDRMCTELGEKLQDLKRVVSATNCKSLEWEATKLKMEEEINMLERELDEMGDEFSQLKNSFADLQTVSREQQSKIKDLEDLLASGGLNTKDLEAIITKQDAEIKVFRALLDERNQKALNHEDKKYEMLTKIQNLESVNSSKEQVIKELEGTVWKRDEELQQLYTALSNQEREFEAHCAELKTQLQTDRNSLNSQKEQRQMQEIVEQTSKENVSLQQQLEEYHQQKNVPLSEISKEEFCIMQRALQEYQCQNKRLAAEICAHEEQARALQTELESLKASSISSEEVTRLQKEKTEIQSRLDQASSRLMRKTTDLEKVASAFDNLQQTCSDLEDEFEEEKAQHLETNRRMQEAEASKSRLEELEVQNVTVEELIKTHKNKVLEKNLRINQLETDLLRGTDPLEDKIRSLRSEVHYQQTKAQQYRKEIEKLRSQLSQKAPPASDSASVPSAERVPEATGGSGIIESCAIFAIKAENYKLTKALEKTKRELEHKDMKYHNEVSKKTQTEQDMRYWKEKARSLASHLKRAPPSQMTDNITASPLKERDTNDPTSHQPHAKKPRFVEKIPDLHLSSSVGAPSQGNDRDWLSKAVAERDAAEACKTKDDPQQCTTQ